MKSIKRPLAAAGAAALLSVSLTACGGGAPTDASTDDYCNVGDELDGLFAELSDQDFEGFVEASNEAAEQLEEVGTPEDIPDDARAGFETMVEALNGLDAGDVEDAVTSLQESSESGEEVGENDAVMGVFGIDEGDVDDVEALNEYTSELCNS